MKHFAFFCALCALAVFAQPVLSAKGKPEEHIPVVNPFIGVWQTSGGEYWRFNIDGTGGVAAKPDGPFADDFSFLVWVGTGITPRYPRQNTLAIARGGETDPAKLNVELYSYTLGEGTAVLKRDGSELTLTRISGSPAPLELAPNPMLGSWEAKWNGNNHDGALGTWSFLYRSDGTVKTYHHKLHQFENAYLVRNNILLIIGEWRFHPALPLNLAALTVTCPETVFAKETNGTTWDYDRNDKPLWK